jgi:hypothetical protein
VFKHLQRMQRLPAKLHTLARQPTAYVLDLKAVLIESASSIHPSNTTLYFGPCAAMSNVYWTSLNING